MEDGTAYELATVVGERFWVAIPGRSSGVVAVPRIPPGVNADLTTATPREAADRFCDGFRRCRATAVDRSDDGYPRVRGDVDADWAGVSLDRSQLDLLHANLRISPGPAPR